MFEGLAEASIRGDPRWSEAAAWTSYAPLVVISIFVVSIIEIVLGVLWIVELDSNGSMTFAQVVQPLIVPGMAFFNIIPSAHLHILARSNPPILAIWFSTILAVVFLASAVIELAACSGSRHGALADNECPRSGKRGLWDAIVGLQLVSAVLYAVHAAMAVKVRRYHRNKDAAIELGTVVEVVDEDAKARREEEARERWRRIVDL